MAKGIDRSVIVAAAFDVLADTGLDRLTVRPVADRLGIKAATLYWHVRNKKDLLDEMSTELWRRILADLSTGEHGSAEDGLRAFAASMRRVLLGVRDGARVFGGAYLTDSSLFDVQEHTLALLVDQGFTLHDAALAWTLVYSATLGMCIEEQEMQQGRIDRYPDANRDNRVDATRHPLVAAGGRGLLESFDRTFDELVDRIMITVLALRDQRS